MTVERGYKAKNWEPPGQSGGVCGPEYLRMHTTGDAVSGGAESVQDVLQEEGGHLCHADTGAELGWA